MQTLKLMRKITRQYKTDPAIRQIALRVVQGCPERDWQCEITRLFEAVRDQIRYVRDVRGVETIATPMRTLNWQQGDCDDKAVLLATLLESIGHPTRFVALKFNGQRDFSHVLLETRTGRGWLPLDTIVPKPAGWYPPEPSRRLVVHN